MIRLLFLALTLLLAACSGAAPSPTPSALASATPGNSTSPAPTSSVQPSPTADTGSLVDREFLSMRVTNGTEEVPLVADTRISISFTADQIGIRAGCNIMGGAYALDGDVLLTNALAMTEMGCDEPRHAQDDWVSTFISGHPTVDLSGNDLVLTLDAISITLLDREVAEPDLGLVGPTWTVDSIFSGDAVSSVPNGLTATFTFADDGTVAIETGCNSGTADYVIDDAAGTISFSNVVLTTRPCSSEATALESPIRSLLDAEAVAMTLDEHTLQLLVGGTGLGFRGE